ncbi:hypothetical protein U9M48_009498 [Paspalum notatum var. saurae]|uniref:Mitochondrial import inner membrane translocase subunit Tim16 n=1 Tax=Paspalum notatum var. saurae TaxID=547442 RepID=A0AAQ3SR89_PASNO
MVYGSSHLKKTKKSGSLNKLKSYMAGKLIANLIVMGSTIIGRAMLQAYRKALDSNKKVADRWCSSFGIKGHLTVTLVDGAIDANKTGVAHETLNNIRRASKTMTEQEARQILGVSENSTWEEIVQRYDNLFERNAKSGSFYLQSKVHRAKECLETVYQKNKQDEPPS